MNTDSSLRRGSFVELMNRLLARLRHLARSLLNKKRLPHEIRILYRTELFGLQGHLLPTATLDVITFTPQMPHDQQYQTIEGR